MRSQDNYQDIYEKLQAESDRSLPKSLQPAAIADLVNHTEILPRKRPAARYVSLAAMLVLVLLAGILGWRLTGRAPQLVEAPQIPASVSSADAQDEYLRTAADYGEIEAFFLQKQKDYKSQSYIGIFNKARDEIAEDFGASGTKSAGVAGVPEAANDASDGTGTAASASAHGETNTQVEDIDEGDILKNDGNYLYIARTAQSFVDIVDIRDPENMHSVSHITSKAENENRAIEEIYVYGDTMVVLYSVYPGQTDGASALYDACYTYDLSAGKSLAEVYDITDRTAPQLRFDYAVDGYLLSSRMDGGRLILLTNYNVPIYKNETDLRNACVPCTYESGAKTRFSAADVCIIEGNDDTAYLTVSLLDTQADKANAETKAVLGGGSNLYCNGDTLLAACTETTVFAADSSTDSTQQVMLEPKDFHTRLFAFDLTNGVNYKGSAEVPGTVLNQFSMDAYNGYYRIATTASDGSAVTVLNESLEVVGAVNGIAKGEQIYAARFLGDTAYLVTFYQTDPLFIVDLSDPQNPEITGELKIPGFSNYLHPYSDTLLIGIGQDGTETGANGKLKISLFDISDKQNPQEISKIVYDSADDSFSMAQSDHKAYLSFGTSGEFAVPVREYGYFHDAWRAYVSVLTVENGTLKVVANYIDLESGSQLDILRATYAGDTIFALSENGLTAFDKTTGEVLSKIVY